MATQFRPEDYRFAGDLSKINPAELPSADIEKYRKTLEEQIAALEQRYAEPNWFKVAAGFAKPQLGGFLASLGSAAEAMGENVEQQRAQQLPIAQMKVQIEQANMMLNQKMKQNEIYQEWLKKNTNPDGTVQPMDAATYSRIMSLGDKTEVAQAATKYYEGAKAGLDIATGAAAASGKDPMLQLDNFFRFQALNPNADQKQIRAEQDKFLTALNAAKPPQIEQAQWNAMSRYEKMEASAEYAAAQRKLGMDTEAGTQQQATQASTRLPLLSSIRDLALGVGLKDTTKMVDGKEVKVNGQQQMAALLNYFGGNNPFEVLARAAADGKLGEKLADIDKYARQNAMSPEARDHFQKLSKLLAENQISLRNSTINPTDAASMLQQAGSPSIGNSQTALVGLVDLMGHSEQNAIDKYKYILDNRIPYRQLGVDPGYLQKQAKYADEHRQIATSNPLIRLPSWYNIARSAGSPRTDEKYPSLDQTISEAKGRDGQASRAPSQAAPQTASPPAAAPARSNERVIGGKTWVRQADGSWKPKE